MTQIKVLRYGCKCCSHTWQPKDVSKVPKCCPRCQITFRGKHSGDLVSTVDTVSVPTQQK